MSSSNEREGQALKTAMKEERARDAKRAMQEYEAEKAAVRAKTARLRALRLANEARNPPQEKTKKKPRRIDDLSDDIDIEGEHDHIVYAVPKRAR